MVRPPGFGPSAIALSFLRCIITKVLLSPCFAGAMRHFAEFDKSPVSHIRVLHARKSRTAGRTSKPAPRLRFGSAVHFRTRIASGRFRNAGIFPLGVDVLLPLRIAIHRPLQVDTAGP